MEIKKNSVTQTSLPRVKGASLSTSGTAEDVQSARSRRNEEQGLVGLVNIGNSCYMNATLQALSNCPPFCQYFVETHQPSSGQSVNSVLSSLLKKVWLSDRHPGHLSPRGISSAMKNRTFKGSQQQDAQEFLRCLLSQIHDELGIRVPSAEDWPCGCGLESCDHQPCYHRDSMLSCDSDTSLDSHSSQSRLVSGPHGSPLAKKSGISSSLSYIRHSGSAHNSPTFQSKHALKYSKIISTATASIKGSVESIPGQHRCSHEPQQLSERETVLDWNEGDVFVADLTTRAVQVHRNYLKGSRSNSKDSCAQESTNQITSETTSISTETTPPQTDPIPLSSGQGESPGGSPRLAPLRGTNSQPPSGGGVAPSLRGGKTGRHPLPTTSIVSEVFEGLLESRVKCLTCKKVSITREPFQDLSLPIPGRKEIAKFHSKLSVNSEEPSRPKEKQLSQEEEENGRSLGQGLCTVWNIVTTFTRDWFTGPSTDLGDCLNAFFDTSELRGDNRYYCSHCKSFQNSLKEMDIAKLPEVLCIHLKRFRFDAYFSSKISRRIQFPLTGLDMSGYLKQEDEMGHTYQLSAVITHFGGAGGGHYVAYAKNSIRNRWYEFNDTRVYPVTSETVRDAEGYVLFYRRDTTNRQPLDLKSLLPPPGTTLPSPNVCYISRHWLHLLKHRAHPGPICQFDFACKHGAVLLSKTPEEARALAMLISKEAWDECVQRYGGGPLVSSLEVCQTCKELLSQLNERRKLEMDKVHSLMSTLPPPPPKMQAKDKKLEEEKRLKPYLLSSDWLQQWQHFIDSKSLEPGPPPAIDNSVLLHQEEKSVVLSEEGAHYRKVSYKRVSQGVWEFLLSTYGGGPTIVSSLELMVTPSQSVTTPPSPLDYSTV